MCVCVCVCVDMYFFRSSRVVCSVTVPDANIFLNMKVVSRSSAKSQIRDQIVFSSVYPLFADTQVMDTFAYINGTTGALSGKKVSLKRVIIRKNQLQQEIEELVKLEKRLTEQRQDVEFINQNVQKWAKDFDTVERNSQGVPFIRSIREFCQRIENLLTDVHGDFYFRMQNLHAASVPCFQQVYKGLELLNKMVTKILRDDATYKASFVEEIRELFGNMTGIMDTMLTVYFEQ